MQRNVRTIRFASRAALAALLAFAAAACARDAGEPKDAAPASPTAGARPAAASTGAEPVTDIDLAACLRAATGGPQGSCPGYVLAELPGMIDQCSEVGGRLVPAPAPAAWSIDVDADGTREVLIDLTENFACEGAFSLFSCGSLGCPVALYARRGDRWDAIAAINAMDAPGIEVLPAAAGEGFGSLRGGCAGERPCAELTYYTWQGKVYERTAIEASGHWVDVAPGGLWTLVREAPTLAAPGAGAAVIERYPAGTEVVVLGKARDDAGYSYVSPCNACTSGFMESGVLKKE